MSKVDTIGIIIARKGSKRIKNKNVKNFFSKPIIYYTINAAKKAKIFDKILISSNSDKIINICKKYDILSLGKRPEKYSNDKISTIDVINFEINRVIKIFQKKPKYICCLYPAAPLIHYKDIKYGLNLVKKKYDYVFTAGAYQSFSPESFYFEKKTKKIKTVFASKEKLILNNVKKFYYDAAQFYWGKYDSWINKKRIFSKSSFIIEIKRDRLQDINTIEDFNFAKKLFRINNLKNTN